MGTNSAGPNFVDKNFFWGGSGIYSSTFFYSSFDYFFYTWRTCSSFLSPISFYPSSFFSAFVFFSTFIFYFSFCFSICAFIFIFLFIFNSAKVGPLLISPWFSKLTCLCAYLTSNNLDLHSINVVIKYLSSFLSL